MPSDFTPVLFAAAKLSKAEGDASIARITALEKVRRDAADKFLEETPMPSWELVLVGAHLLHPVIRDIVPRKDEAVA